MPQSRGLVKITVAPQGDFDIMNILNTPIDWFSDSIPYFVGIVDWMLGTSNVASDQRIQNYLQQALTEVKWGGGYIFYAEDCQVVFHGKDSENFPVTNGGNTTVRTNSQKYREVKFKTTISPRNTDNDLYGSSITQSIRNSGWANGFDFINEIMTDLTGARRKQIVHYLNKRKNFLMDLDGKDVYITSELFPAIDGSQSIRARINTFTMSTPSGQEETTYELNFTELIQNDTTTNVQDNENSVNSNEPGTTPLPDNGQTQAGATNAEGESP
jgi:hypothetical protein